MAKTGGLSLDKNKKQVVRRMRPPPPLPRTRCLTSRPSGLNRGSQKLSTSLNKILVLLVKHPRPRQFSEQGSWRFTRRNSRNERNAQAQCEALGTSQQLWAPRRALICDVVSPLSKGAELHHIATCVATGQLTGPQPDFLSCHAA